MTFQCKFTGLVLPLGMENAVEWDWPNWIRLILYLLGLFWTFLGVGIISDIFMNGIEKVTSLKKRKKDPVTGKVRTVYAWNMTVANLTLMALGSSAPEILLSLIEITTGDFLLGPLGAGTIVGSAAFNLLIISAVCVAAIPDGEVRKINQIPVYVVTASCSVFAYLWLMFILMVTSPDVCEIWEAVLTLIFCPILVLLAYLADRGYFSCGPCGSTAYEDQGAPRKALPDNISDEELAEMFQDVREEHGAKLTDDQVIRLIKATYVPKASRAHYRNIAMQATIGGSAKAQNMIAEGLEENKVGEAVTIDDISGEQDARAVRFSWATDKYGFMESCGHAKMVVVRQGPAHCKAQVNYKTRDGTANAGSDYDADEGTLVFEKEEREKAVFIKVNDDLEVEEDEEFFIDLSNPKVEDGSSCFAELGELPTVTVTIVDDDGPGKLRFKLESMTTVEDTIDSTVDIIVERFDGATGTISCAYHLDTMGAVAGVDYEETSGRLEFAENVCTMVIPVTIKARGIAKKAAFNVVLDDPKDCAFDESTDGGEESCICNVTISSDGGGGRRNSFQLMRERIQLAHAVQGEAGWKQQFVDAIFKIGDDDDDEGGADGEEGKEGKEGEESKGDDGPSKMDIALHVASVPWKLLFAFVPPAEYCGGWACFYGALFMIAIVTALVGDMANLVGCCFDILPETGAITFVALGTSLPDTFASMTAAKLDPHADASIGNVTGSNSINVFMGIGLAWCVAAFYWETQEPNANWKKAYDYLTKDQQKNVDNARKGGNAVFIAPAGSLWFNLMVFSVNAGCAIGHLACRRRLIGGELGGPKKGFMGQYFSAFFLASQWFIYVAASIVFARVSGDALSYGQIADRE